jgi:hypothetical protein
LLIALAAAIGAGLYYYQHVNDEIRRRVQQMLAAHYQGLSVEVGSALLIDGEGIEIRGVRISDPQLQGAAAELAYLDEIKLSCSTELQEFLSGKPHVDHVVIRRPRFRATRQPNGIWTAARLLPCPKFGKERVETIVENGVLEITDATRPNAPTFTLRQIDLRLRPIRTEQVDGDEPVQCEGSIAGDYFRRIAVKGRIEPGSGGFRLDEAAIDRLDISPELFDTLPSELAEPFRRVAALRATCECTLSLVHRPDEPRRWQFSAKGSVWGGRFDDSRLPHSLSDLSGNFEADNTGITLREVTCKFGQASLNCFARLDGFSVDAPMFIDVTAQQLLIGRNWEPMLSPEMLATWHKFLPAGEVDARLKLWHSEGQWRPEVAVACRNVSFTYHKFPYRIDRGRGALTLKDNRLSLDLLAQAGGRDIKLVGEFDDPGPHFTGALRIWGNDLALEPRIIEALPEKPRNILNSLRPACQFGFFMHVYRSDPREAIPHQELTLDITNGSVRYEKFPYPINNIQGQVEMQDGVWWSNDLEGTNGTGNITCQARLEPTPAGAQLRLDFDGRRIALEDELRDSLSEPVRAVWNDLRPRGSVDLSVHVRYIAAEHKPDIQVRVRNFPEDTSLEPVQFPYRLEGIRSSPGMPALVYRDGEVRFQNLHAVHGSSEISASGYCRFDRGAWWLHFDRITADRLRVNSDLLTALPPGLKQVVAQLRPTGPINVDGAFDLIRDGPDLPVRTGWNVEFNLVQSTIHAGPLLENVNGAIRLRGQHDGRQLRSTGELAIDSLSLKDFHFSEIRGPLQIDDRQVIFGSQAETVPTDRPPRRVTAKLYGGTVTADLWVSLGDPSRYHVQATLADADLERFGREHLSGKQRLQGKAGVGLDLQGAGSGLYTMAGKGQIWLRDADIYELPFMVRLLSILSIRLPDKRGFTSSEADFQIAGEHIYLNRIEFSGDAISLLGKGEVNLDGDVQTTLSAVFGRSDWQLPLFKNMMGQASQQIMQIRVDGNLANLQIHREPFPVLNQALEQLQAGMQPRVQPQPPELPQAMAPGAERR